MNLTEHVSYELRDQVAVVTLTRPEARNALTHQLAAGLVMAVDEITGDRRVRAVLLTGQGPTFCAGGDLKSFAAEGLKPDQADLVHRGLLGLHRAEMPVIAAIQGAAIGYGLGLACSCDIRLAAEDAIFQAGFTGVGLSPNSMTSYFLPRLAGPSVATRMMLTNLPMTAEQAREVGFVSSVHPGAELADAATALALRVAGLPSGALRRAKALLQASLRSSAENQVAMELALMMESFQSDDFREGVTAFTEKRPAIFSQDRQ